MKRIVTSIVVTAMVVAVSLSAFATTGFNTAVFNDGQDITVQTDPMTGITTAITTSLFGTKGTISTGYKERVSVYGGVSISDNFDLHDIIMMYNADDWAFINEVIFKIGDTRYYFTELKSDREVLSNATIRETVGIVVKNSTIPFMQDLIENRDKEVRVRLCGQKKNVEFVMTDDMKNSVINLYNLFVTGGGTKEKNMSLIERGDKMQVRVVKTVS